MSGDAKDEQNLARSRLTGLRTRPRSDWDEQDVRNYHDIVTSLEAAYRADLSVFRIPNDRIERHPVGFRRGALSGRVGPQIQYSSKAYCDASFVQQQLEGLVAYTQTLGSARPPVNRTPEAAGATSEDKGQMKSESNAGEPSAPGTAAGVIESIRPALNPTQSQIDRIAAAEQNLTANLNAHEQMRELMQPDGWTPASRARPYDHYAQVLKLRHDIHTYIVVVLNVLAEACLASMRPEAIRQNIEECTARLLTGVIARIHPRDLPLLDRDSLETDVMRVQHYLVEKAVLWHSELAKKMLSQTGNTAGSDCAFHEFPKVKCHWTKPEVIVANADDEKKLGGGWGNSPGEFAQYRAPRIAPTNPHQVAKWVDEWPVSGLNDDHRKRMKAQLLKAHSAFWKSPEGESADVNAMRLAFEGIANVLLEAGILTQELMQNDIVALVWDSAVAGGWYRYASETPKSIFPEQIGHYFVWRDETRDWGGLFAAETAALLARLIEAAGRPEANRWGNKSSTMAAFASGRTGTDVDPHNPLALLKPGDGPGSPEQGISLAGLLAGRV